jgi:hydrogenase/urease accessory protein HupE
MVVGDQDIKAVALFHSRDLQQLIKNGASSYPSLANQILRLQHGGESLPPKLERVERDVNDNVKFQLSYIRPAPGSLTVSSGIIGRLPFGHREFVTIRRASGESLGDRLLSARENEFSVFVAPASQSRAVSGFADFFLLGIRHILTGYDHLLFLLGILIVCSGFFAAARIITCFTLAHSITLALATFHVVNLSNRIVEPLIAASIVYVGCENLVGRNSLQWRWILTFAFGLFHGLGFASVLKEMGVGESSVGIALPLVSFNLGVETGQLAIAALILPLAWKTKESANLSRIAVPWLSAIIVIAGTFWFVQRVFLA